MLFNSFGYLLIFLPCVVLMTILARRLSGPRAAQLCVLVASLLFYAWFSPSHLPYLLGSMVCNALLARRISAAAQPKRKRWLELALVLNVGFLAAFKYINFLLRGFPFSVHRGLLFPDLEFPLGISFFTVAQIMYLVDCYEKLVAPSTLLEHATFVSFFPYVISGPIAKAKRMVHQFGSFGTGTENGSEMLARGCYLISIGLFKKIVFAFAFGYIADFGFAIPGKLSALEAWVFTIAYTLQIYFDFSGYTDMAVGSAMLLGIQIPRNFDAPLRSKSIIEFWKRWHITLSNFITTYLYTPILKSFRNATLATAAVATLVAMTIAGLWHGPAWTFVLFGTMHGVALVVNQYWRKKKVLKLPMFLSWMLTFMFVASAFAVFRAVNMPAGVRMLSSLFNPVHGFTYQHLKDMHEAFSLKIFGLPIVAGAICAFYGPSSDQMERSFEPAFGKAVFVSFLTLISWLFMNSNISQQFVYFKF